MVGCLTQNSFREAARAEREREYASKHDNVCTLCGQLALCDESELLECDGSCLRSFHLACMDLTEEDIGYGVQWLCPDCDKGAHECRICGDEVCAYVAR